LYRIGAVWKGKIKQEQVSSLKHYYEALEKVTLIFYSFGHLNNIVSVLVEWVGR
jgi:hypothetical protein